MNNDDNIKTPGPLVAGFLERLHRQAIVDPDDTSDQAETEYHQECDEFPWTSKQSSVIKNMVNAARGGCLIVLCGPRGTGKTSMAKEVQRRIGFGTFELAQDYFEAVAMLVQGRSFRGAEEMKQYRERRIRTRILILDEIHLVGCDPVGCRVIQDIVIRRHAVGRPTVLITNAKPDKIELDDSILDRAEDAGGLFHVGWESFRGNPR
jgi:DNA replication protein DnaC